MSLRNVQYICSGIAPPSFFLSCVCQLKDKLNETKAAKKAIKEQEKGTGNGLVGGRLISRFDQQEKSKVGDWAHTLKIQWLRTDLIWMLWIQFEYSCL